MGNIFQELVQQTGLDESMVQKGMGALLKTVQESGGEQVVAQVTERLPETKTVLESLGDLVNDKDSGSGAMDMVSGLAGAFLGKGASQASSALGLFSKVGFSMETLKLFLPTAIGLLKKHLPDQVGSQLTKFLPEPVAQLLGGEGDNAGNLLGKLGKFF